MRLKTFAAATMTEAMDMVRRALGDEAVIVSTFQSRTDGHVEITAAVEADTEDDFATPEARAWRDAAEAGRPQAFVPMEDFSAQDFADTQDFAELLQGALTWHGVPGALCRRLVDLAMQVDLVDAPGALAGALDELFRFPGLSADNRPLILMGPAGSGKSIAVAKLAARSVLEQRETFVISCDTARAAAGEQLAALCRVMGVTFQEASDADELSALMGAIGDAKAIIDTAGINPYAARERDRLKSMIRASGADPLLVLAAGGDPLEAADIARIFAGFGVRRMLPTRLDASRRLGGLLAAADAAGLSFADAGCSPFVGKGFERLDPLQLAHFLLRDPDTGVSATYSAKAAE